MIKKQHYYTGKISWRCNILKVLCKSTKHHEEIKEKCKTYKEKFFKKLYYRTYKRSLIDTLKNWKNNIFLPKLKLFEQMWLQQNLHDFSPNFCIPDWNRRIQSKEPTLAKANLREEQKEWIRSSYHLARHK